MDAMNHIFEVFHSGPADYGRFHVVAENRQQAKSLAEADYPQHQFAVFRRELIRPEWRYHLLNEWRSTL